SFTCIWSRRLLYVMRVRLLGLKASPPKESGSSTRLLAQLFQLPLRIRLRRSQLRSVKDSAVLMVWIDYAKHMHKRESMGHDSNERVDRQHPAGTGEVSSAFLNKPETAKSQPRLARKRWELQIERFTLDNPCCNRPDTLPVSINERVKLLSGEETRFGSRSWWAIKIVHND